MYVLAKNTDPFAITLFNHSNDCLFQKFNCTAGTFIFVIIYISCKVCIRTKKKDLINYRKHLEIKALIKGQIENLKMLH